MTDTHNIQYVECLVVPLHEQTGGIPTIPIIPIIPTIPIVSPQKSNYDIILSRLDREIKNIKKTLASLNDAAFFNIYDVRMNENREQVCALRIRFFNDKATNFGNLLKKLRLDVQSAQIDLNEHLKIVSKRTRIYGAIESDIDTQRLTVTVNNLRKDVKGTSKHLRSVRRCIAFLSEKKKYLSSLSKPCKTGDEKIFDDSVKIQESKKLIKSTNTELDDLYKCRNKTRYEKYIDEHGIKHKLDISNFSTEYVKKLKLQCKTHCFWQKGQSLKKYIKNKYGSD
jgi:hypothetical protein